MQLAVTAGLEFGASELQVQRSNHSATLPDDNYDSDDDIKFTTSLETRQAFKCFCLIQASNSLFKLIWF